MFDFYCSDLKPANLLLRSVDALLLTDFGSAVECPIRISDAFQRRSMLDEAAELCTMPYRAPELFTCDTGTVLDVSVDIWVCVLFFGLGKKPFVGLTF